MRHWVWESYYCPSAYLLPSKLLFSYILQSPFLTFARNLFFSIFFPLSLCPCFHRRVFIHAASLNPPDTDPSASLSLTISYLYPNIHKSFCVSFKVHLPPNLSPVPTCPAPILHVNPAGASTAIGSASALCLCPFSVRDFPSCLGQEGGGTNRPGPKQDAESSKIQRTLQVNNFALHLLRTAFKQPFKLLQLLVHLKDFLAKLICSLNGVVLSILRFASKLCMWTSLRVQVQSNYLPISTRGDQEAIPAQSIWHQSVTLYWVSSTAAAASSVAALPSSRCYLQCAFAHLDLDTLLSKHLGLFLFDKTCFKAGSFSLTVWESGLSFQTWCRATLVLRNNQHPS